MSFLTGLFLTLSSILNVAFVIPYTYETLQGSVRPNRVSWFLWLMLGVASLFAVLKAGGQYEAIFNFFFVLGEGIIFLLALLWGESSFSRIDAIALIGGVISFICLFAFNNPIWTLVAVLVTDFFGFLPTWTKSWRDPSSESLLTYTLALGGCFFGYLAVADRTPLYFMYPLYLTLANTILVIILLHRRNVLVKQNLIHSKETVQNP